jgi:hypothetical protein
VKRPGFLGSKKRRGEDNHPIRSPHAYFKPVWFSKPLYQGFEFMSSRKAKTDKEN